MLLRLRTANFGGLFSEGVEPDPLPPPAALRLRRQAALHENLPVRARRVMRVLARFMRPRRVADLPATFDLLMRDHHIQSAAPPDPHDGLPSAEGLAGRASDLTPGSMMEAYGKGLSPSACLGPVAWHSRVVRFVATPADILGAGVSPYEESETGCSVTFDHDIEWVLARGGRPPDRSAIMPARLLEAFAQLFDAGFAHSFEVRNPQGETIGGGFGVAIGGIFTIEGAFENVAGAARLGLSRLALRLADSGFALVECGPSAAWLDGSVFRPMAREDYLAQLALHMGEEKVGRWRNSGARTASAKTGDRRLAA
jgi:leucyl/phenylalanyl-tRNA---protein transferase